MDAAHSLPQVVVKTATALFSANMCYGLFRKPRLRRFVLYEKLYSVTFVENNRFILTILSITITFIRGFIDHMDLIQLFYFASTTFLHSPK